MMDDGKIRQGTLEWFEMVGELMLEAAERSGLSPHLDVSLVERYVGGAALTDGLFQGLRFDIRAGKPSFRAGARKDERADITIDITPDAARRLNLLRASDPDYGPLLDRLLQSGDMQIDGDPSRLGGWLREVHDPVVERTK